MKKVSLVLLFSMLFVIVSPFANTTSASSNSLNLTDDYIVDYADYADIYIDEWDDKAFKTSENETIKKGIGLMEGAYPDAYVTYDISNLKYTTFETKISIDGNFKTGSLGNTEFVVYADNKQLFTKTFTNTTKAQKLELAIPKGTKEITIMAVWERGAKESHRAIFGNPTLTNKLTAASAFNSISLNEDLLMGDESYFWDLYVSSWDDKPFKLSNGTLAGNGFGFDPQAYGDNVNWAEFDISDYKYTTLETTISIDKNWSTGDRGKTQFIIYADDEKIYSSTFVNDTALKKVKAAIPAGTKTVKLMAASDGGKTGKHAVIFADPILTNSLPQSPSSTRVSLHTIGYTDGSYAKYADEAIEYHWMDDAFQLADGSLEGYGYGMESLDGEEQWLQFYIKDYQHTTFEANVSLENKWRLSDKGSVDVYVIGDEKVLYKKTLTNHAPSEKISVNIPAGTSSLYLQTDYSSGNKGTQSVIFGNPYLVIKDTIKPYAPVVNTLGDQATAVKGNAELGSKVTVKKDNKVLAEAPVDGKGAFSIPIAKQKAGIELTVTAADKAGNISSNVKVTVKDQTPPAKPTVNTITSEATKVTGKAEASSTVTIKAGSTKLGEAKADKDGKYSVAIKKQKPGVEISVTAKDAAGNISAAAKVKVTDKTPPAAPSVNEVTSESTKVTGKTEKNAVITVKAGSTKLGEAKADKDGKYSVSIKKQKPGVELSVTSKDAAGNVSKATKVKVKDKTPPAAPKVDKVTKNSTKVTGKTEANSTVTVKAGSTKLGEAKANKEGKFSVSIKKQKQGKKLSVTAKDAAGNVSKATSVTVK